jgi:ribose 5-phosphate isomerase A
VVVVDETKVVKILGAAVPVEILPFAVMPALVQLRALGCVPVIREAIKKDGPVITDNGNFVADCTFANIKNPGALEAAIAAIPGVVESGLFCGFTKKTTVIVGGKKKCTVITSPDIIA